MKNFQEELFGTFGTSKRVPTEDPLLRSGIVLAGANRTLQNRDPAHSEGIVTAEKILGINLSGTEMVVLSACQTGLGEVRSGEGVFGLRRAFSQAGAKGIIMSMWKVPDYETRDLIVCFYRNLLEHKMNLNQALRQAALEQKEKIKKKYHHTHPLFWGGFVFAGEPSAFIKGFR